jgi:MFS family permease
MMAAFLVITASVAILAPMAPALHTSSTDEVWVASIYSMAVSCLVLTAATVGDVIGRRQVFAAGVFVLGLGSLLVALAADTGAVILGQAVMGIGGAMVLPNSLAIVANLFVDPRERTAAVSAWAAVSGLGLAAGPALTSGLAANLPGALTSRGVPAPTAGKIAAVVTAGGSRGSVPASLGETAGSAVGSAFATAMHHGCIPARQTGQPSGPRRFAS